MMNQLSHVQGHRSLREEQWTHPAGGYIIEMKPEPGDRVSVIGYLRDEPALVALPRAVVELAYELEKRNAARSNLRKSNWCSGIMPMELVGGSPYARNAVADQEFPELQRSDFDDVE